MKRKILCSLSLLLLVLGGCGQQEETANFPVLRSEFLNDSLTLSTNNLLINNSDVVFETKTEQTVVDNEVSKEYINADEASNWIFKKEVVTSVGTPRLKEANYLYTYDIVGNLLSKVEVPNSETFIDGTPTMVKYVNNIEPGMSFVSSRTTRYGVDCVGCYYSEGRGGTASGINVGFTEVKQRDGSWQQGYTYEGYYIIAASSQLPLCTVVEISNHGYSGSGITPGQPFKAIVADRGGAINGRSIDLFIGTETNLNTISPVASNSNLTVTILSLNSRGRGSNGWYCNV